MLDLLSLLISLSEADLRTDGTFVVVYHDREPTEEEAEAIKAHKATLVSMLRRIPRRTKGKGTKPAEPPDPAYLAFLEDHPYPSKKPEPPKSTVLPPR
jgi:hypothetical protein